MMKKLLTLFCLVQCALAFSTVVFEDTIQNASTAGQPVLTPDVGMDACGRAIAIWATQSANSVIQARRFNGTNWINSIVNLSDSSQSSLSPQLSVNACGQAAAVWENPTADRIEASTFDYCTFTPIFHAFPSISTDNFLPKVSINDCGIAFAIWREEVMFVFRLFWSRWDGVAWTTPALITNDVVSQSYGDIGVDSVGNAIAVWDAGLGDQVKASLFSGGSWSAIPFNLTTSGQTITATSIQVAVAPNGTAVAVWNNNGVIQASRFDGTSWTPRTLSGNVGTNSRPSVDIDDNGNAVVIWVDFINDRLESRYFVVGTGWNLTPILVSPNILFFINPKIAVYPNGDAVATWGIDNTDQVQAAFFNFTTKVWEDAIPLTLSPNTEESISPAVAVSADRSAIVVWDNDDSDVIQSRVGLAPPTPPNNLKGIQKICRFPTQSECFNRLTWQANPFERVVLYRIFRNGKEIGEVSANCPLEFDDHNRCKNTSDTYEVFAVDDEGNVSEPATITIN